MGAARRLSRVAGLRATVILESGCGAALIDEIVEQCRAPDVNEISNTTRNWRGNERNRMAFIFDSIVRRRISAFCGLLTAFILCLPLTANAQLVISEFRVRGPNGANDEFIEIYNNTGADHTVAAVSGTGYGLAASDGVTRCTIPNGTIIPNRGHYLCVNSVGYSLASYPAGNGTTATGDATYTTDIPDNAGIALFNNNTGGGSYILANRFDAVGSTSEANTLYKEGTGYPALTPFSIDYSFTRRPPGGCTGSGGGGNCTTLALIQTTPGPATNALVRTPTTTPPTSSSWTPTAPAPARASGWGRRDPRT